MNETSLNESALDETSLTVLGLQLPANIFWVLFGLPGFVANFIMFIAIVRDKKLRANFFLCQLQLTIADGFFCLLCTMIGFKRVILLATQHPETTAPINCVWHHFLLYLFENASSAQTVCIALDRLLCVCTPAKYLMCDRRQFQLINLVMWIWQTIALIAVTPFLNPELLVPTCTVGQIGQPIFNVMVSAVGVILNGLTIMIYAILFLVLQWRLCFCRKKGKSLKELKQSIQYRAVITSFMLFGVYTCISLTSQIYLLGTSGFDPVTKSIWQPWVNPIALLGSDLAVIVCVVRSCDIQTAIKRLFALHKNHVDFSHIKNDKITSVIPNKVQGI